MRKLSLILFLFLIPVIIQGASTNRQPSKIPLNDKNKDDDGSVETTVEPTVDEMEGWECGGEELSKYLSFEMIKKDCPALKDNVNNCCIKHDKCYDDQEGQVKCDNVFCACLDKATYSADNSTEVCYEEHSKYFCNMVKEFGESFYEASVGNQTLSESTEIKEEQQKEESVKLALNETKLPSKDRVVRIYESKTYEAEAAFNGLPELDNFN